jgi:hypothetical protein
MKEFIYLSGECRHLELARVGRGGLLLAVVQLRGLLVVCQILPLPIYIPKQLGLGFNKTNQQLLL